MHYFTSLPKMSQLANKRSKTQQTEEDEDEDSTNYGDTENHLIQCANLILPWLNPQELATISSTCKPISRISRSITLHRSLDASRSMENQPIPFHNPLNDHHHRHAYPYFLYTPSQLFHSQSPTRQPWGNSHPPSRFRGELEGPRAEESAQGVSCECDCEKSGGGGCEGVLGAEETEMGILMECGSGCRCGLECANRFTQRGISVKLKIVRDGRKGWGLFADQLILRGQFVCEYAGELLTTEEARRRQQIYDKLSSGGRFSSALLVVREHLPSGKACLRINIDATRVGNVARFINHSCDGGNLSSIVVRSSGAIVPRLCFFASRDIKENEELTFSYGEIRVRSKGLQCFCGSKSCYGILPSETT